MQEGNIEGIQRDISNGCLDFGGNKKTGDG
jgi:hypothetical protein